MALNPASSSSPAAPRTNIAPSANRQIEANKRASAALEAGLDELQARHLDLQNQYNELQSRSKDHERVLNARLQNLETKLQVLLTGMKRVRTTAIEKRAVEEEVMGGDEQEEASGETDDNVVDEEGEAAAVARSIKAAENYLPISVTPFEFFLMASNADSDSASVTKESHRTLHFSPFEYGEGDASGLAL
ncbi:hypothetical protein FRC04_007155 [Tulasnella sp. 424]|nr:hypothetical protein FRC04_007155 [Tulasnella sp. 424]KAG8974593.1 hypothetical protein FRC05_007069 [Tulasnella sp. 425]